MESAGVFALYLQWFIDQTYLWPFFRVSGRPNNEKHALSSDASKGSCVPWVSSRLAALLF